MQSSKAYLVATRQTGMITTADARKKSALIHERTGAMSDITSQFQL